MASVLKAAEAKIGLKIQMRCPEGHWYNATTVIEDVNRGNGPTRVRARWTGKWRGYKPADLVIEALVTSKCFRWRTMSKVALAEERDDQIYAGNLAGRNVNGTWRADKIIAKRGRKVLIRWQLPWTEEDDTWEDVDGVTDDLLEAFNAANAPADEPIACVCIRR